jgi:outer membrane protein
MTGRLVRSGLALFLAISMAAGAPVYAQDQTQGQTSNQAQASSESPSPDQARNLKAQTGPDYSRPKSGFPNIIAPYTGIHIDAPALTNSPRVDQLIHEGKLMLSLDDAISLALENNLDISVQRYVPWISETDILRTRAGGAPRGTSGVGTAGVLGNIPQTTYDPILTSSFNWSRTHFPVNNPITSGTGTGQPTLGSLTAYSQNANFGVSQGFHTGTGIAVFIDNARNSSSSAFQFFNPAVQSTVSFQVQQQLLNGFGLLPNTRFILESKNNRKIADSTFAQQVILTVTNVANFYWEVVFARENVKVQQAALATSQKLYEDNKKQVEIGTLAPIEIVRAESEVATDRQNLIVAQTTQMQEQTLLLNAITKNPLANGLLDVEVVPTAEVSKLPTIDVIPLQDAVKEAWSRRPELAQSALTLKNDNIEVRGTRNALLPTLTAFGQYSGTGLAGNHLTTTLPPVLQTSGIGDALGTAFGTDFPTYAAGFNFTMAIRNRSAQADNARALLTERQDETKYRQLQNQILVDVRNAQIALQQDQARVEAAMKARELAQQTLDAEAKKYQLGASTVFFVIQAQRDLTTARGNEIRALADLQEARVNYDKALGRTLDVNHITVADAMGAGAYHPPLIPGTPSADLIAAPVNGKF